MAAATGAAPGAGLAATTAAAEGVGGHEPDTSPGAPIARAFEYVTRAMDVHQHTLRLIQSSTSAPRRGR